MGLKWVSLVAFVVLIAAIAGLLVRHSLLAHSPVLIGVQFLAVSLMLWAQLTMGWRSLRPTADPTEGGLVTSGPYRLIRHPIYSAILFFVAASVSSHLSMLSVSIGVVIAAATTVRIVAEEYFLSIRYPQYRAYAARTKRIVPFVV